MTRKSRVRSISSALAFGLLGKSVGFLVPVAIAATFGVSRKSDSFFLAFAVASVLLPIWSQSVEQFAIPLFAEVEGALRVRQRVRWLMSRAAIGAFGTVTIAAAGLLIYLSVWSGADFRRSTMVNYLLLVPQVLVSACGAVYSAYVISRDEYRWSAGSVALRAVGVLLMVAVAPKSLGLASVAVGYSVGETMRAITLRLVAERKMRAEGVIATGEGVPPADTLGRGIHQLGSMATAGIGPLVERSVAAPLGAGLVTRLEYATKLFYVPSVLFDTNFVAVFLSGWSRLVAQGEWAAFARDVRSTLRLLFGASLAVSLVMILAREPLTRLALLRGAFTMADAHAVASVFGILLCALPFYATSMLASAAFVAAGENRLILNVSVLKVCLRSLGSIALGRWFGLEGIAVAFVLMHVAELAVLCLCTRRLADRQVKSRAALESCSVS